MYLWLQWPKFECSIVILRERGIMRGPYEIQRRYQEGQGATNSSNVARGGRGVRGSVEIVNVFQEEGWGGFW